MALSALTIKRLRKIKKLILEEPKRINMSEGILSPKEKEKSLEPKCGTVGCIAGWAYSLEMLKRHGKRSPMQLKKLFGYVGWETVAATGSEYLGLDYYQHHKLFYPAQWPDKFLPPYTGWKESISTGTNLRGKTGEIFSPQTPGYAQVVADRIEYFISTGGTE